MIENIFSSLRRDLIVSKKVIIIGLAIVIGINIIALVVEPNYSTMTIAKAIIISSMILNLWVVNYGFRQEELPSYKYIIAMSDISIEIQILARFILFLIIPMIVLLASLLFNMPFLMYIFAGVLLTSGASLFTYYLLGTQFIGFPFLISFGIVNLVMTSDFQINFSTNQIVLYSLGIYIMIAGFSIICEKLGWNVYSKIPEN